MRSFRSRWQTTRAAAPAVPRAAGRNSTIGIAATPAPLALRAALLGGVWLGALALLAPDTARATDATWIAPSPNPGEWTQGINWSPSTVPDNTATFANNGATTSVTISNNASINTIDFSAAVSAYSFTVQNGATFAINGGIINNPGLEPAFTVNAGSALTAGDGAFVEIGSLAGGGRVTIGPSDSSSLLSIVGNSATTFSGQFSGAGSLELDNGASLTLTGASFGGNIGTIGGDLTLCGTCSGGSTLTISGGSLTVNGVSQGVTVESGTLAVINGGTLLVGTTPTPSGSLLVASNMIIDGAGSTVTVAGLTGVGIFGPGTLTISNGGVLNSQIGAEIDFSLFPGTPTVTVTGTGSTWNVGGSFGFGFAVGGGSTGGPGALVISNGGTVTSTTFTTIGDSINGTSSVLVTGSGSVLNAFNSLQIGDTSCGCGLVGTLTIADGGVVNSPGATSIGAGSTLNLGIGGLAGAIVTPAIANDGQIIATFTDTSTLGANVSGAGSLSKAGAGTLILTGNSSYTGATTINAGTLQLGNGGASGSIAGNVTDNGVFAINRSDTFTFGGVISGSGAFAQLGIGTTILTGVNSYNGGTAIAAGTLAVGADNNLGAAAGGIVFAGMGTLQFLSSFTTGRAVTLNATGSFDTQGNADTLAGAISGAGGLSKIGTGTLTLTGASSYTGATSVNAGTLQAGATNTFAPLSAFTVASGGTLNLASFNQSIGSLAGAGSVALGAATLTTGNDNTSTTFSGTISGSGSLIKVGTGTLTLAGANAYTGGTTLAGGTLSLANNQALGSGVLTTTGSVVDYASGVSIANAIVINSNSTQLQVLSGSATQAGAISELNGPRPLEKIGAGTLVLSGVNTYSGPTTVSGGALIVTGSIANSPVTVGNGAVLTGIGTVGAATVLSGGTFAPGPTGTPGAMSINGNLAFQSGAVYLVQVNPSTASSANVTAGGTATLAGTVAAAFASGSYVTRNYTILSAAGGLNGTTFNTLTTSNLPAGFTASLGYTANAVLLNLTATLGQPSGPSGPGALGIGGLSINQTNVANALNNFFNSGGALPPAFVNIFGLTGGNLANALTLLSGEAATGSQQVAFQLGNQFLGIMLDPFVDGRGGLAGAGGPALGFAPEREEVSDDIALAYAKILKAPPKPVNFDQRWSVWGAGYGGSNRTTGDPAVVGSHDLAARAAGGAAGLDYRLAPGTVVGFALAGAGTNWDLAQGLGGGKSDAFQAGIYGATQWGASYLAAALAFTDHWMSTDRFAFAGDHLTASFNAQSFGGRVEGGYRVATFYGGLTPYAAIQAQSFHTPGYSENDLTAGGFALGYNSRNATDTRSELGARFDRLLLLTPEAALTMRARLAWAHDWISDPTLAALFQTLPGAGFVVNGATPAKNSALTSAGAELRLANGVALIGKFDGEFASHSSTYAGTGTVRYTW
jgi:autotransporter-associated beta strand protein/T5SS/PEP-CTERM-associated repeat protein